MDKPPNANKVIIPAIKILSLRVDCRSTIAATTNHTLTDDNLQDRSMDTTLCATMRPSFSS